MFIEFCENNYPKNQNYNVFCSTNSQRFLRSSLSKMKVNIQKKNKKLIIKYCNIEKYNPYLKQKQQILLNFDEFSTIDDIFKCDEIIVNVENNEQNKRII